MIIQKTGSTARLIELLDSNSGNPNIVRVIEEWKKYLCESNRQLSIPVTEMYTSKLSGRLRMMIEKHIVESLKKSPSALYNVMLANLEKKTSFLDELLGYSFSSNAPPQFQEIIVNSFQSGTFKIMLTISTMVLNRSPQGQSSALFFLESAKKWLDIDLNAGLRILDPTQFSMTAISIFPFTNTSCRMAFLSCLCSIYSKISQNTQAYKNTISNGTDLIWSPQIKLLTSLPTIGETELESIHTLVFELLNYLLDILPQNSMLGIAIIRHCSCRSNLAPRWFQLLQRCINTTDLAKEISPAMKRLIHEGVISEKLTSSLISLYSHCTSLQQVPDKIVLAQLSEYLSSSSNREICASILEFFGSLDPTLLVDFLTEIMSCFRYAIYFDKVSLLLDRIRTKLKNGPIKGRGEVWFSAKVQSHLFKMGQELGGSFDVTIHSVLGAISSA